jgi:hypothetical protein
VTAVLGVGSNVYGSKQKASADDTLSGMLFDLNDETFDSEYFKSEPESGWIAHPLSRYVLDKE